MMSKDLSRIISASLKKKLEKSHREKKIEESIEQIKKAIELAEFEKDKLLITSDNLYLSAKSLINTGRKLEGLKLLVFSLFGYYISGDLEKMRELISEVNKLSGELEKELIGWEEYDKAFLIKLVPILLDYIDKGEYQEPNAPEYLGKVFPYLRDMHKVLVLKLFGKIKEDFFEKRIERYSNYSEKKGLLDYWNFVWEVFNYVDKIRKMKEAYLERVMFEKM